MHLCDRHHAAGGGGERRFHVLAAGARRLQVQQRGDDLEGVADAVIDLAHEKGALGRERFEAVARGPHLLLCRLLGPAQPDAPDGLGERRLEQVDELPARRLDDVVGGARLQGCDRDRAFLRPGDVDDGRWVGKRVDFGQHREPVAAGHVVVERHRVVGLRPQAVEPGRPVGRRIHGEAAPLQVLLDEAAERRIVVDIEEAQRRVGHAGSGTWITEKKSPS